MPTVESLLPDLEQKLPSIIAKLDKLPLEEIGENLKNDLATLDETLKAATRSWATSTPNSYPSSKSTLEDARKMIASAERVMKGVDDDAGWSQRAGQTGVARYAAGSDARPRGACVC